MVDFSSLAQKYGSPLYVYNFDVITHKFTVLKEAFKARKSLICFAAKANSNLSVLKHMAKLGASVLGGCCGTTPDHIKHIADEVAKFAPRKLPIIETELV